MTKIDNWVLCENISDLGQFKVKLSVVTENQHCWNEIHDVKMISIIMGYNEVGLGSGQEQSEAEARGRAR